MFEERIAEVPNEAIVFIEDTKEIWNHGHYFAGEGVDPVAFDNLQTEVSQMKADKQDTLISGTNIKTINGNSILGEGNIVVGVDTSNLATKEEVNSLVNDAISSAITNVLNVEV